MDNEDRPLTEAELAEISAQLSRWASRFDALMAPPLSVALALYQEVMRLRQTATAPIASAIEARVAQLEQRLGSATDTVVCCATPYGEPCGRHTTRINADHNWAGVGAAYYCPQCWARICGGRG